jgi:hypothetical protein
MNNANLDPNVPVNAMGSNRTRRDRMRYRILE